MTEQTDYRRGFLPYALAAFLIGIVGGFSTVLGPAFVRDIGIAYENTTWTALAQAISTAAAAPILGKLGDMLGRRRTLTAGLLVFTLGNILSALASSLAAMLAARFVVGLGIAAMTPVIIAYIISCFPKEKTAKGFSEYMLISGASVVVGPTVGSLLTAHGGWRVMLWVCVGLCAAVLAVCLILPRRAEAKRHLTGSFDIWGAISIFVFFSLLLCLPSVWQNIGLRSGAFRWVAVGATVSLVSVILSQRSAAQPVLPLALLRRRSFVLSVAALFLTQGLLQANMTNSIIFVNYTLPDDTIVSGYAISIMYLGMSLGAALIGPLADRIPEKRALTLSLLLTGLGCALQYCFSGATPTLLLMASLGLLGFGLGGNGTVFLKVALSGLPEREAAAGTGTYTLFRDLAAPFGVAVLVPMFSLRIAAASTAVPASQAAVQAIHALAAPELIATATALALTLCLPKTKKVL